MGPILKIDPPEVLVVFEKMQIPVLEKPRFKIGSKEDLLLKATGIKKIKDAEPLLLDLTAGLGRDAYHMSLLGFQVVALEANEFLFRAVSEAIKLNPKIQIQIFHAEAKYYLNHLKDRRPHVIFYDPMFPEKKKSAAVKKEAQLLQSLGVLQSPSEELELAQLALQTCRSRLVIKRPIGAEPILNQPNIQIKGKAVRYDVYLAKEKQSASHY